MRKIHLLFILIFSVSPASQGILLAAGNLAPPGEHHTDIPADLKKESSDQKLCSMMRAALIESTGIPEGVIKKITDENMLKLIKVALSDDSKNAKRGRVDDILSRFTLGYKHINKLLAVLKSNFPEITMDLMIEDLAGTEEEVKKFFNSQKWASHRENYGVGGGRMAVKQAISKTVNGILKELLTGSDKRLIDIGAGEGWLAEIIEEDILRNIEYIPFDINPNFLKKILEKGLCKETIEGNVYSLSEQVHDADILIALDSFIHFLTLKKPQRNAIKPLNPAADL